MAGLGSVTLSLSANTKDFRTKMGQASKTFKKFGSQMKRVGGNMTRNITMPLTLIGGASVKMAADFDTSLRKINTLVGVSKEDVAGFKDEILDLAGETAQSPVALADGLYFLTSAGLEGANALETLTAVAKANTAGLGDQTALAKVAAAAQNAYGEANLTAADSLDIFGKMVKTGMFESDQLAEGLGSLMGLSSSLSVDMEELGAFISTYTKTTGDANLAMTGVNAVMMSFAKITPKAEKALNQIGLTGDGVKDMLSEKGLQGTLIHLQEAFEKQGIPMTDFFSKGNAIKGVLGVLGNQTDTYIDVLDDMRVNQGFVNDAFDETAKGPAFQFKQLLEQLKVIGIQLGDALMPVVLQMVEKFKALADKFSELSPKTKDIIVKIALVAAAVGPLLMAFGAVLTMLPAIGSAMALLTGPIGLIVGALAMAAVLIVKNWNKIKEYFTSGDGAAMFTTIKEIVVKSMLIIADVVKVAGQFIADVWAVIGPFVKKVVSKAFKGVAKVIKAVLNVILTVVSKFSEIIAGGWEGLWNGIKTMFKRVWQGIVKFLVNGLVRIMEGMAELLKAFGAKKLANAITNTKSTLEGFADGLGGIANESVDTGKEIETMGKNVGKYKEEVEGAVDESLNLDGVVDDLTKTVEENTEADKENSEGKEESKKKVFDLAKSMEQFKSSFEGIDEKAEVFGKMGEDFDAAAEKANLIKSQINTLIDNGVDPASTEIQNLVDQFKNLEKEGLSSTEKLGEGLQKFASIAGQIMGDVGAIFSQYFEMKMQGLENDQAAEEGALQDSYEKQVEDIENSTMNQGLKDQRLQELADTHGEAMTGLDEKYALKMAQQKRRQAIADKAMAIAGAIINTAAGVASALPNIPLATAIGIMGGVQIGLIAATPIPAMAQGGIVTGPTTALIGEAGPEAVIPLSKLGDMQTVNVVGKISGDDIILVSDRARQNKTRVRGINS